jgi:competence protein ComEC
LGHHGSKTANSPELLSAISPKLAVVSAGRNNRYGHPNAEVIERLQRLQIPVVSTQDYGMISYRYFFNGMGRWKVGIDKKGSIVQ